MDRPTTRYQVRVLPALRAVDVELLVELPEPAQSVLLATPTWVPGAYAFMRYARDLSCLAAHDADRDQPLPCVREGWSGWRVQGPVRRLRVRYRASAADPAWGELVGVVAGDQAVLLGTHYLGVADFAGPVEVTYLLPDGWGLHHPSGAEEAGRRTFRYPTYGVLVDTPVVAGRFVERRRVSHGVPFHALFLDQGVGFEAGVESLLDGFMGVAEAAHGVFGGFPFESYSIICSTSPTAHWGLEHASSTMVSFGPHVFIDPAQRARAIRVVAHELFHAWNVCRLKPAPLGRADLVAGSFPDALWVSEGFTRYYEFLLLVRAGELSPAGFFGNVVNYFRHLSAMPAYARVSAVDSSRSAFLNHWKYPGSINNTVDYYDVGMLVAFEVDAFLRARGRSLDALFSAFYEAFAGRGGGFTSGDLEAFFEERCAGAGAVLRRSSAQAGELQVPRALEELGFGVEWRKAPYAGLVLKDNVGPELVNVLDDAPAAEAGLGPGDELLEVGGFPFDLPTLKWLIAHEKQLDLRLRRAGVTREARLVLRTRDELARLVWRGDEGQRALIAGWLGRDDVSWKVGEAVPLESFDNFHGIQAVV